jgi:PAS domain S-box-containing protein
MLHKNGSWVWVLGRGNVVKRDENSKPVLMSGTNTDITEQKKINEALIESEDLFRTLIEVTPYPIALNDMEGRYIMVNKAFCSDTGYDQEEIIGKKSNELGLTFNFENENSIVDDLKKLRFLTNVEVNYKNRFGKIIYGLFSTRFIQRKGKMVILSSTVNISEKKIIELELENHKNNLEKLVKDRTEEIEALNEELTTSNEELYQNNEELFLVNETLATQKKQLEETLATLKITQEQLIQSEKMASVGVLTAGIAHEINNPVNFISSGITGLEIVINDILMVIQEYTTHCEDISFCKRKNMLNEGEKKHNLAVSIENISKLLQSIHVGVERTTNIVKSLRTFSRLDNENKILSNIHELIDSTIVILGNKIKDRITIVKEYGTIEPVKCYPGKLSQVFLNLLINAIQSIENKGTITIVTQKSLSNETIEIIIRDTGKGMSMEIQKKIFDPFFTTKPVGEGTGMGLSIVHGIIRDHNGEIAINSNEGQGSEFTLNLPIN